MSAPLINEPDLTKGRPPMTTIHPPPMIVQGFCPYGHGETLYLTGDGRIKCSDPDCERPFAVNQILANPETGHLVFFGGKTHWSVIHPVRENLDGSIATCTLGDYLASLNGDPMPQGQYRAILVGEQWTWGTPIEQAETEDPLAAGAGFLAAPEDIPVVSPGG